MDQTIRTYLLVFLVRFLVIAAQYEDSAILESIKNQWENTPPSWEGSDPCGNNWEGIVCTESRVTSITLASTNLKGELSGDITNLSELKILDLSYNKDLIGALPSTIGNLKNLKNLILVGCGFTGLIPDSIGSMQELVFLSLNLNSFSGHIPASIGNLSKLYWLDLADNKLSGDIPVSTESKPGLDMLLHANHFHFGKNQLSGVIPPKLFSSNMSLIHVRTTNVSRCLNLGSYNYLGFAAADEYCTPRVIESMKKFSPSTCSTRTDGGGKLLLELNRLLRPGGYFVWSATPIYRIRPRPRRMDMN